MTTAVWAQSDVAVTASIRELIAGWQRGRARSGHFLAWWRAHAQAHGAAELQASALALEGFNEHTHRAL